MTLAAIFAVFGVFWLAALVIASPAKKGWWVWRRSALQSHQPRRCLRSQAAWRPRWPAGRGLRVGGRLGLADVSRLGLGSAAAVVSLLVGTLSGPFRLLSGNGFSVALAYPDRYLAQWHCALQACWMSGRITADLDFGQAGRDRGRGRFSDRRRRRRCRRFGQGPQRPAACASSCCSATGCSSVSMSPTALPISARCPICGRAPPIGMWSCGFAYPAKPGKRAPTTIRSFAVEFAKPGVGTDDFAVIVRTSEVSPCVRRCFGYRNGSSVEVAKRRFLADCQPRTSHPSECHHRLCGHARP